MFGKIRAKVEGWLIDELYALGIHRSIRLFELLSKIWPEAFHAIFRCECGRNNSFLLFCSPDEEEGLIPDDPDWWRSTFDEISEIIERAPSPMGYDEYGIHVQRLGPLPGETDGVLSSDTAFLKASRDRRPVLETRGIVGDRYFDWRRGEGKTRLEELLRWADPSPEAPLAVVHVMCIGQGVQRIAKAMGAA